MTGAADTDRDPESPRVERRRYRRVDVEIAAPVERTGIQGLARFTTLTLNLSEGGVMMRVPAQLAIGEELRLVLHLPSAATPPCTARVVRSEWFPPEEGKSGAWAAAEFVDLSEAGRAEIAAFVASRLQDHPTE
ncbi:MAG TPA: PilZ domain-containing protein [Longimicrobiaceae bacterium]|nr:PilZ domain-containing protein [Longimicrobiaceae bacterium]